MIKIILFICFVVFNNIVHSCSENKKVIIEVYSEIQDDGTKIFITGNKNELGNWNPGSIPLKQTRKNVWNGEFYFKRGENIEFKFTLGTWGTEALDSTGKIPGNYSVTINEDTTLVFRVIKWKHQDENPHRDSTITGKVDVYKNMGSKYVPERDIIVWLPPEYGSSNKSYPVLYMQDGQNAFNSETSFTGTEWRIDEIADSLIRLNKIQDLIIVAIYNTEFRNQEYSSSDTGFAYIDFIIKELKPFVDRNYRTKNKPESTAVLGSSLGGLISFLLTWEKNNIFGKAACFSPAFKIGSYDCTRFIKEYSGKDKNIKLFIYNGGIGLENQLQPGIEETLNLLYKKGYSGSIKVKYDKTASHNEKAWSKVVPEMLQYFFQR